MAVEILHDQRLQVAAFYCTTEDRAFGPVFKGNLAADEAEDFLAWLDVNGSPHWAVAIPSEGNGKDIRQYPLGEQVRLVEFWRQEHGEEEA